MTDVPLPATARDRPFPPAGGPDLAVFLVLLAGLTIVRLIGLRFSAVDLYFDESQYWAWSRELAFGYFSKPPLIAWIIAAADVVCGSGEACVRAPAPLFYFGMALAIYAVADQLYGGRVAFWAGLTAALAPGIVFSSRVITTDVPLLLFWAVALLAYVRLRAGHGQRWAVLLAVAFGLGILAKYAMVYFVPCAVVAGLVDRRARALLKGWPLWLAFAGGALFFVPNLVWNLDNGLITMVQTGGNITGPGAVFDIGNGLGFLAAQFAVGGPVVFATFLVLAARSGSPSITADDRTMLAFSLPLLAVVTGLAFVAKANGNWAAPAFVSAFVVVPAVLLRLRRTGLVVFGVALGLFCQAALLVADPFADRLTLPLPAPRDIYAPTLGWRALGAETAAAAARTGARTIVATARRDAASLIYYARDSGIPVYAWPSPRARDPRDHFELTRPLPPDAAEPILAVSTCSARRFSALFGAVTDAGSLAVPTGPTSSRTYCLHLLTDQKP